MNRILPLRVAAIGLISVSLGYGQEWSWEAKERKEIERRGKSAISAPRSGHKWIFVAAKNYDVYAESDVAFTAELSLFMDEFWDRLTPVLGIKNKPDLRPKVFVFAKQDDFKKRFDNSGARGHFD